MDMTCVVGTDIASFLLYDPEALEHRASSPWGWFLDFSRAGGDLGALTIPERTDGRLVLIDTAIPMHLEDEDRVLWCGSDGTYHFRCTTEGLTPDEIELEYPETRAEADVQIIHVTRERLLLDGGYLIPCDHTTDTTGVYAGSIVPVITIAEALEQQLVAWLALPNGTYRVTAHHLALSDEDIADEGHADEDEVAIVLTFERV
jgi:hypothetical protein